MVGNLKNKAHSSSKNGLNICCSCKKFSEKIERINFFSCKNPEKWHNKIKNYYLKLKEINGKIKERNHLKPEENGTKYYRKLNKISTNKQTNKERCKKKKWIRENLNQLYMKLRLQFCGKS